MKNFPKWLSESFIIAGAPVLAYMYSYTYNSGFGSHFGVPPQLVTFSLPTLFSSLAALIFALFATAQMFNGLSLKDPENAVSRLFNNLSILVIAGVAILTLGAPFRIAFFFFSYAAFFACVHLVGPIISMRKVEGYSNKLEAHFEKEELKQGGSAILYLILSLKRGSQSLR